MKPWVFGLFLVMISLLFGCKSTPPAGESTSSGTPSSASSSASVAKSGCYNAYYPARATLKKTYKITYGGGGIPTSNYTESYSNLTSDGFMQKLEFAPTEKNGKPGSATNVTVEGGVKCKPDGLAFMEYGNLTAGQNLKYKYKTNSVNGVSFPNEGEWQVGKKWQMVYDVEGQMTNAPVEALKMNPKGTITIDCEIIGKESVTVATGTYDAFKVAFNYTSDLKMNMMGREMPMKMSFQANSWFAKDVGLIKSTSDEFKAVTELVAFIQ